MKNVFQYIFTDKRKIYLTKVTLQSRDVAITVKDNVTSFTLKPGSIIEFSAVLSNSFGYMVTYTQYS